MYEFRGREVLTTVEEMVDPRHAALLVYDATYASCGDSFTTGSFMRAVPDMLPRWERIIEAARQAGVPVIYTRVLLCLDAYSGPFLRYLSKFVKDPTEGIPWVETEDRGPENQIVKEIAPQPGDIVMEKYFNNAYTGTAFDQILKSRGIKTIVQTGISTESGIENNARWAIIAGYYPVIVTDCVNSGYPEMHASSLRYMERSADLATADEIIEIWSRHSS
ncbi:MAG: cysteine hydrolase [Actinomycetota bacterium]|nr:MAG: cysteine hydrolase [Actinomycetota bacterium]